MTRRLTDVDTVSVDLVLSVAELGGISRAAQRHGLSQPSASRRIRDLERRLGINLFERTTNGAVLSAEGRALAEECRVLVEAAESLLDRAAWIRRRDARPLNLAVTPLVARFDLARLCSDAGWERAGSDPATGLSFNVAVVDVREACNGTRDGSFDLALVDGPRGPVGLTGHVLSRHQLVLIVGRHHRWWNRTDPVGPDELGSEPLWLPRRETGTRDVIEDGLNVTAVTGAVSEAGTGSTDQRLAMVALGANATVIRTEAAADILAAGRARIVPTDPGFEQPVRLVWKGRQPVSHAAWDFWHRLRASIDPDPR